jgi:hypothetical protein
MKRMPLGIQNIKEIIEGGYVYADKTSYVYDLINNNKYCFLSRPRRFGKSLLLDTIAEVFSGNKELFKGLFIYGTDHEFAKHPVLRIDMSNIANDTPEILRTSILSYLSKYVYDEGFDIKDTIPSDLFGRLIESLYKKYNQRVVVLIDEYDKPILDHLDSIEEAEANRKVIRGFYGILKSMDPYLRFVMLTGVTKFTKTSIFSELNNLTDITMDKKYANICGIEIKDLEKYFGEHIKELSKLDEFKQSGNLKEQILSWYDGYSWDGETRLLNPFSLLSFISQERFKGFWFASGTPKFLMDLIKKKPETYTNLRNLRMSEKVMDSADIDNIAVEPLLFQTGYLTVKEVNYISGVPMYLLDIPNYEVNEAFNFHIVSTLTERGDSNTEQAQLEIVEALQSGDLQRMLIVLRSLFASIPYQLHVDVEAYYHSVLYAVLRILGFDIQAEVPVSKGRADAVLELDDKVYVMEFKYEKCPPDASDEKKQALFDKALGEAMEQIKEREYHKQFIGSGKTIHLAAFAFLGRDEIEMRVEVC